MPGENILSRAAQVSTPTVHMLALRGWPKAVKARKVKISFPKKMESLGFTHVVTEM